MKDIFKGYGIGHILGYPAWVFLQIGGKPKVQASLILWHSGECHNINLKISAVVMQDPELLEVSDLYLADEEAAKILQIMQDLELIHPKEFDPARIETIQEKVQCMLDRAGGQAERHFNRKYRPDLLRASNLEW